MWRFLKRFVPTRDQIVEKMVWAVRWADRKVPRGFRTFVGIPLMIGGVLSFLPVLGLWMLPAGAVLIALDVPSWRRKLLAWVDRQEAAIKARQDADEESGGGGERDGGKPASGRDGEASAPPASQTASQTAGTGARTGTGTGDTRPTG